MNRVNQFTGTSYLFLSLLFLTGCGPALNPYNEDFKCRAKDDMGECIVIQLLFHADSHIDPILKRYRDIRTRDRAIVRSNTDAVITFLTQGKKGLKCHYRFKMNPPGRFW